MSKTDLRREMSDLLIANCKVLEDSSYVVDFLEIHKYSVKGNGDGLLHMSVGFSHWDTDLPQKQVIWCDGISSTALSSDLEHNLRAGKFRTDKYA